MREKKIEAEKREEMTRESFSIIIVNQQNATWQGNVLRIRTGEQKNFRSALELLKLIDSTLDSQD